MRLSRPRRMFSKYFLATERTVAISPSVTIASHISIGMAHIVTVLLVEHVVCDLAEAGAPEDQTFFEIETNAFEEEGVLKSTIVFEVGVAAEGAVQVLHAEGEGGGDGVNCAGGDVSTGEGSGGCTIVCVGGGEVLRKVRKDGGEAVIFVQSWKSS